MLWNLFSFVNGKYNEYQLYRDDKLVSTAEVVTWLLIFPFMPRKGIHIAPCRTMPEERGKGYYSYLLRLIVEGNPEGDFYMIVNESNTASIRGVEKAGFFRFAVGKKTRFGRYVITKHL